MRYRSRCQASPPSAAGSARPGCRSGCGSRPSRPSARSSARASVDLPAPRSPCRCTTACAGRRVAPARAPSASVASASASRSERHCDASRDWPVDAGAATGRTAASRARRRRAPPHRRRAHAAARRALAASNARHALRAQRRDHAGQHVAHAADRHAGIARVDHARRLRRARRRCVPAPLSTTTQPIALAQCAAPPRSDRAARRAVSMPEQARRFARDAGVRIACGSNASRSLGEQVQCVGIEHQRLARRQRRLEQRRAPLALAQPGADRDARRRAASSSGKRRASLDARRAIASGRARQQGRHMRRRASPRSARPAPAAQRRLRAQHDRAAHAVVAADAEHAAVRRPCGVSRARGRSHVVKVVAAVSIGAARAACRRSPAGTPSVAERQLADVIAAPAPVCRPRLARDELERARRRSTAAPGALPRSASTPLGTSSASTGAACALMALDQRRRRRASGARDRPMPNKRVDDQVAAGSQPSRTRRWARRRPRSRRTRAGASSLRGACSARRTTPAPRGPAACARRAST